ncbi:MAG TPA: hypothetical protein VK858_19375 [Longimicrobiales bacterium]|nr:hypothetical protein [Longimicrobiales bacterium]
MRTSVETTDDEAFDALVDRALERFEATLDRSLGIRAEVFSFHGPHLTPNAGAYQPLDFLRMGLGEKIERGVHFLLIVTEVDLAASTLSFAVALPSQLTNVGVVSTKRLDPAFWGEGEDGERTADRLSRLMLHTFGHLLNLRHHPEPTNVMYDFHSVEDLDGMGEVTSAQKREIVDNLPVEARERVSREGHGRWGFVLRALAVNARGILEAVWRANPFRLLGRLPTMLTAALSVVIVLFFSPEMWDVASTVELYQLVIFALLAVTGATFALYRTFAFGAVLGRDRILSESAVVTEAATILSLFLTVTLLYTVFVGALYGGIVTIFPRRLMETWPTVDPAVRAIDHLKLSLFIGGLGVLAGSLGGRADSRDIVRGVLFIDEES